MAEKERRVDLSIIVPVYKGKEYLNNLMGSVCVLQAQAGEYMVELLLIDDGSPDGSGAECRQLSEKYRFVSAYEKENGGIADTRNFGLRHAKGEYVCFMDQDDTIVPETCIRALKKIRAEKADCCLWSSNHLYADGKQEENVRFSKEAVYCEEELRQALLDQYLQKEEEDKLFHIPGYVWSGVYDKKFLKDNQVSFFSFVDCEDDCIFMNQVMRHAKRIVQIPDVGYLWTCNLKSESHRSRYIGNYWEKVQRLDQWFQSEIYDIFEEYRPPKEKVQKTMAVRLYTCVENECSLANPASSSEVAEALKSFFGNVEYYQCILNETKPYGGAGMRRQIMHRLILGKRYRALCWCLRMYERVIRKRG